MGNRPKKNQNRKIREKKKAYNDYTGYILLGLDYMYTFWPIGLGLATTSSHLADIRELHNLLHVTISTTGLCTQVIYISSWDVPHTFFVLFISWGVYNVQRSTLS